MFLFPWLDWGNDISDFENINFFDQWAIFGDFGVPILSIFGPQENFVDNLRPAEYSDGSKSFFSDKYDISAFKPCV